MTLTIPATRTAVVAQALADCLCAQVAADGLPDLCFCGVVPGALAVADKIGSCGDVCGMAWVRIDSIYPSMQPGVPDALPGNCQKALAIDLELAILRCYPADPDFTDNLEAAELAAADAECLFRTINCCPALVPTDTVVGPYTPTGPDGATVGGAVLISTMVY